ncbi:MAG: Na+/H+ antiporter NhaA [Acidobacteriota bacterium]
MDRLLRPFREFAATQASGGLLLLGSAIAALAWANSPWWHAYQAAWHAELGLAVAGWSLTKDAHFWINDGLMAVFFFVVGLEIKREIVAGELSRPRQAMLPIAGALGGMVLPAALYATVSPAGEAMRGWGVPMATDIAFAIGVMALLGTKVPVTLKVFVTALAIVDDLGAVLVIAVFYTDTLRWGNLALAALLLAGLLVGNRLGMRSPAVYALGGVGVWLCFLASGVHATVAGVLVALTVPARVRLDRDTFLAEARARTDEFAAAEPAARVGFSSPDQLAVLSTLRHAIESAASPLQRLEHALHPWVSFAIMPLFAFANAGVRVVGGGEPLADWGVAAGVTLGLVAGKPLGIAGAAWLAVRTGVAERPAGTTWAQLVGVSCLGGIGFTMALFIAALAFSSAGLLAAAKVGILAASLLAGMLGWAVLSLAARRAPRGDRPA